MPLTLHYVARSDPGLMREVNEDSGYAGPFLLAVADGMGGHAAGEVASQAAIEELVQAEHDPGDNDPLEALGKALRAANDRIRALVVDDPEREGMGTTVTAFLWTGKALAKGHIGDSRAYVLRDGDLIKVTHDHTFVQSLIDEGRITPEEAAVHPARSLILKALQGQPDIDPDLDLVEVQAGDRVLVCSDGLDNARVSETTIRDTLMSSTALGDAADELVQLARAGGGPDNITVVLADVVETDKPTDPDDTVEAFLVGSAAGNVTGEAKPQRRRAGQALRTMLGGDRDEPVDPEAMRYAPQPLEKRSRWVRPVLIVGAIGLVCWAGLSLANRWVGNQYYVGESSGGDVAIYQGLSQEVGPIRLSDLYETPTGLPLGALPDVYQARVRETMPAESLPDAQNKIANLRDLACESHLRTPTPEPKPSPTNTKRPRTQASPKPTPTPTPTPTIDYPGLECPEQQ